MAPARRASVLLLAAMLGGLMFVANCELGGGVPTSRPPCTETKDCPSGLVCKNGGCEACVDPDDDGLCGDGRTCVEGTCTMSGCHQTDDCAGGLICKANTCSSCTPGLDDLLCGPGLTCDAGVCRVCQSGVCCGQGGVSCSDDGDCCQNPAGSDTTEECREGLCGSCTRLNGRCRAGVFPACCKGLVCQPYSFDDRCLPPTTTSTTVTTSTTIFSCEYAGSPCSKSSDCCEGLTCLPDGTCGSPSHGSTTTIPLCGNIGATCGQEGLPDCCANESCLLNQCCANEGAVCSDDSDCCGGFDCRPGADETKRCSCLGLNVSCSGGGTCCTGLECFDQPSTGCSLGGYCHPPCPKKVTVTGPTITVTQPPGPHGANYYTLIGGLRPPCLLNCPCQLAGHIIDVATGTDLTNPAWGPPRPQGKIDWTSESTGGPNGEYAVYLTFNNNKDGDPGGLTKDLFMSVDIDCEPAS